MARSQLLTVEQVARELDANPETVRRWLRSGQLKGVRPGGDKLGWRIPEDEFERFLEERGIPARREGGV